MGRLLQIALLAAIIWMVFSWWNSFHVVGPNSKSIPTPTPPVVTGQDNPSPPSPATPGTPANANPSPSGPDLSLQLSQAKSDVVTLAKALEDARAPVLTKLQTQTDYQQAKANAADLQQKARYARARGDDNLADLSAQWIAAKNKVSEMETAACAAAPDVQKAADALDKAQHAEADLEKQIADAKLKSAPGKH